MKLKNSFYIHPKERTSLLTLLGVIISFSFLEGIALSKLQSSSPPIKVATFEVAEKEELYLSGCFEANLLGKEDLLGFGLDSTLASRWINFRNSIGGFDSINQIGRIFGMSEEMVENLRPILTFDQSLKAAPNNGSKTKGMALRGERENRATGSGQQEERIAVTFEKSSKKTQMATFSLEPFSINSAGEADFMQIRGIGPVLSDRIVRYRERLGGFHEVDQLKEVFGLDSTIVDDNRMNFIVEKSEIRQIDFQRSTFREVLSHPYLEFEEVQCLFNVKQRRAGAPECKSGCFTSKKWNRVKPYLKTEQKEMTSGI
ncbi:MAG: hypothetical protein EA409_06550 [Saprospirales bacterium]|nr:MAG: hypothetical protein EA409_06550 [Saprospirales bacterium]